MILMCGPALAAAERPASARQAGQLDEFVIEGVPRIDVQADKPLYSPDLSPAPAVLSFLAQQQRTPDFAAKALLFAPDYLPVTLASPLTKTPWRARLTRPPILDILVKQPKFAVERWRVVITNDRGQVFQTLYGKGRLPDRLTWDGRGKNGEMLRVGHPYAYSYHVLDRAEVPSYLPGKTILLRSLVHEHWGRLVVALDTPIVFDKGPRLSVEGMLLLREVQDLLRESGTGALQVTVYGWDQDLARRQAELLSRRLSAALLMQPKRVRARAAAVGRDGYDRTEIGTR
ncbi:MAG TPA: hypothetical protein DEB40_09635 [Elusimicrobia bacterium]|nr:hypothetical protein [Elusimicrobiota bacterium]HBT61990.1 hypothetical protein [Elusimicrobiota bacterium]